jgi:hypothetical protein
MDTGTDRLFEASGRLLNGGALWVFRLLTVSSKNVRWLGFCLFVSEYLRLSARTAMALNTAGRERYCLCLFLPSITATRVGPSRKRNPKWLEMRPVVDAKEVRVGNPAGRDGLPPDRTHYS